MKSWSLTRNARLGRKQRLQDFCFQPFSFPPPKQSESLRQRRLDADDLFQQSVVRIDPYRSGVAGQWYSRGGRFARRLNSSSFSFAVDSEFKRYRIEKSFSGLKLIETNRHTRCGASPHGAPIELITRMPGAVNPTRKKLLQIFP